MHKGYHTPTKRPGATLFCADGRGNNMLRGSALGSELLHRYTMDIGSDTVDGGSAAVSPCRTYFVGKQFAATAHRHKNDGYAEFDR
jgi:hypothetical protein